VPRGPPSGGPLSFALWETSDGRFVPSQPLTLEMQKEKNIRQHTFRSRSEGLSLSVGLLVAGICGLLFFWPNDLPSLALFALTIAAGFGGGVIGRSGRI
jgi:hypothetical protein